MDDPAQIWFSTYTSARGAELRRSSRDVYAAWWRQFVEFVNKERLGLPTVTADQARRFLERYHGNTAIRYYRLLSSVYETAMNHELCKSNPLAALKSDYEREEDRVTVATVPADVVEKLYSIKPGSPWKKHRDRALVLLSAEAGLRRSELLTLRSNQLFLERIPPLVALVDSQTAKKREIELSARLASELRSWLQLRAKFGVGGGLAFPANDKGEPLNPSTVYRVIERHLGQVGAGKEAMGMSGARVLRASLAQRTDAKGVGLPELQKVLGHRQLMSTADLVDRTQPYLTSDGTSKN